MDYRKFIEEHLNDDPLLLRLKYGSEKYRTSSDADLYEKAITQIECMRKFKSKFPLLLDEFPYFNFPSKLSCEQASNELVSKLHGEICQNCRTPFIDITTGLGIDFINIAKRISRKGAECTAVELDKEKAETLRENLDLIGLEDAVVVNGDGMDILRRKSEDILKSLPERADKPFGLLFADPARRGENNSRIFNPSDCVPDVTGNWEELLKMAEVVVIKNSPMLDIHKALEIYPGTTEIYIISVKNECKELLVVAGEASKSLRVSCINIISTSAIETFEYNLNIPSSGPDIPIISETDTITQVLSEGRNLYLYEPNASIMKSGAWGELCKLFKSAGLKKLSPNCHLFISSEYIPDFMGRSLKIEKIIEKNARKRIKGGRYNVVTRNYPMKSEEIQAKYRIKPDDRMYIYGVTLTSKESPLLLECSHINI